MADHTWTEAQRAAIEAPTGALLVSAAAGSGKTSVLVERIARLLTDEADPCPPQALLVVTFTNAAAAEMRGRIFQRVKKLAAEKPERAAFFRRLTGRLSEMQVSTMDSFCVRLVREYFSDCGVEADFEILEEGEEAAVKRVALMAEIEERYAAEDPGFLALTRLFDAGRDDAALVGGILALSDFSMSEPDPDAWLMGVGAAFDDRPAAESPWGRILLGRLKQGLGYCLSLMRDAAETLKNHDGLWEKNSATFEDETAAIEDALAQFSADPGWDAAFVPVQAAFDRMGSHRFNTVKGTKDDPCKVAATAKRSQAKDTLKGLLALHCCTEAEHFADLAALRPAVDALVECTLGYHRRLFAEKQARNRYGFGDVEHFALRLLCDPGAEDGRTPLARQIGAGLREILIDEYQDTNRAQDTLFRSLSREGRNLFTVGDVKQSIYRFRLASPEIFIEKSERYPRYTGSEDPAKIVLDKNFRSRREVTDTVNDVFSALMSPECGEIDYSGDERLTFGADYYTERGGCETEWLIVKGEKDNDAAAEAEAAAGRIARYLAEGFAVQTKNGLRPCRPGDFCILLRSGKGVAERYAAALRRRGIAASLDSRAGFFDTAEIRLALSFLNVIDNPHRDVDLLAVMLSPLFGFTPGQAARVKNGSASLGRKGVSLYARLVFAADQGDERCAALIETLTGLRRLSATLSCDELLGVLFDETPLLQIAGAMPEGALRVANLRALQEAALRFCADGAKGVGAFLRYLNVLRENGGELKKGSAPADGEAVQIMTTHRSKGLEFPVVFLAGSCRRFNLREGSSVLSVSHEYGVGLKRREPENVRLYDTLSSYAVRLAGQTAARSEELRIWYVAMTRAKEKLIVLSTLEDPDKTLGGVEALLPAGGPLPPFAVSEASSPFRWLASVFLRHPDAAKLRQYGASFAAAESRLSVSVVEPPAAEEEEAAPAPEAQAALVSEIASRFSLDYPYLPVSRLGAKGTASSLSERQTGALPFADAAPAFLYDGALTPAERGVATHRFLETCDFARAKASPKAELARLVGSGRLTERAAGGVDLKTIAGFFASGLYARIEKSETVYRERRFTAGFSVCDLYPGVDERFRDEITVVDGMTDLIFIEDGEAVIVDYKTDRVPDMSVLVERYRTQMEIYTEAVARTLGIPVKETVLYSLTLGETASAAADANEK